MSNSTPQSPALKVCKTCGTPKPLTEYGKYTSGSYRTDCNACLALKARERRAANPQAARDALNQWRANNREKRNATHRERYANDPEYRQARREEGRRRIVENRERIAELRKQRYLANLERERQRSLDSDRRYPERKLARLAVKYAVTSGKFPPAWTMVCEHCQEAQAAHWHHHKGYTGEHKIDVIALCVECHGKEHRAHES